MEIIRSTSILFSLLLATSSRADALSLSHGVLDSRGDDFGYVSENSIGPGTLCVDVEPGRHPSDYGSLYSCQEVMKAYRGHRPPISNR